MNKLIFPFIYSLNMFSVTMLIVLLGLFGQSEMAADTAIVHAATLVAFMAFSGNARNIILSHDEVLTVNQLLTFRLILVLPLSFIAYLLSYGVLPTESFLVKALILRRALEWLVELQISEKELHDNFSYAKKFSLIQGSMLTILCVSILFDKVYVFEIFLYVWAISPLIFLCQFIQKAFQLHNNSINLWKRILPHLGSTWVISCSAYIFRLLIILLAGKTVAGILFSAYAIGGMMNSIYTYAVGPSMARLLKDKNIKNEKKYTFIVIAFLILIGVSLIVFAFLTKQVSLVSADLYLPIGLSLVGGAIMIIAQRQRIHILQLDKNSVFVPDVIINILIISTVPFSFYVLGVNSFAGLFVWNAILTFLFYKIPSINVEWMKNKFPVFAYEKEGNLNRDIIQAFVLFFLFMPLFFQLNGSFLFHSSEFIYEHGGSVSKLPLPYSMVTLFFGLMLIMKNYKSALEVNVLFAFFILMMFSVYITSFDAQYELLNKIIFLIQFILPVFALVLGRAYIFPQNPILNYQNIFLLVLVLIIPFQLFITLLSGSSVLLSDMRFFSIYQHLQYVPTILVSTYGVVSLSYKDKHIFNKTLSIVLFPLMWVYAVFSASFTAITLMFVITIGLFCQNFFYQQRGNKFKPVIMVVFLVGILFLYKAGFFFLGNVDAPYFFKKIAFDSNGLFRNLNERLEIWKLVWDGILESDKNFWFGHSERMSKQIANSAHNYYFDLIYHFGFISLLPLLGLIIYTIYKIIKLLFNRNLSADVFVLALFVLFLLLIDNSLKVGLRQPYSGIISFFLWGVLLSHIMTNRSYNKAMG